MTNKIKHQISIAIIALVMTMPFMATAQNVCSIGATQYTTLTAAYNSIPNGGTGTIKLLRDIDLLSFWVNNKTITLDLNGYTLNLDGGTSYDGLTVSGRGELKLLDPFNGALNVATGASGSGYGGVLVQYSGKAEVTNARCYGNGSNAVCVNGSSDHTDSFRSSITVHGNVTHTGTSGSAVKVGGGITTPSTNNSVIVNGTVTVPSGVNYANTHYGTYTQSQYNSSSSRPGYYQYGNVSEVYVKRPPGAGVCSIGTFWYPTLYEARSTITSSSPQTVITLHEDISQNGMVLNSNQKITFDLNGYTLTASGGTGAHGIVTTGTNNILLLDPKNGEFNVSAASTSSTVYGAAVRNGSTVEVTNIKNTGSGSTAAYASGSSNLTVFGNVTHTGSSGIGVEAYSGGKITVEGIIDVPSGVTYIRVGSTNKTQAEFTTPTTKAGYLTYTDGTSTVWVKEVAAVCEIEGIGYATIQDAIAAVPEGAAEQTVIKLLTDINTGKTVVANRKITLDLNGYTLNVDGGSDEGLMVYGGANVLLLDPANGSFNVLTDIGGFAIFAGASVQKPSGIVEVSNVTSSGAGGSAVYAQEGELIVYGNVTHTGTGVAAYANQGGRITVEGSLQGASYIRLGSTYKTQAEFTTPTTKAGYFTYTDGTSTVWVKIPVATYTVTFAGDEIDIEQQSVTEGNLIIKPADPERANYDFGGWFTDNETFLNQWNFATDVVTQDTTLYAKWEQTTGIVEIESAGIKIYPNPVKDELRIESNGLTIKKMEILDITGKTIVNLKSGKVINVSALPSGIYLVKIETDNGVVTRKFVKQ